jgi:hypothetical protein
VDEHELREAVKPGAELIRLVTRLMRNLEGAAWAAPADDLYLGVGENGQFTVTVGEAVYVDGPQDDTIIETTSTRVRIIGPEGVLEEQAIVRPELN